MSGVELHSARLPKCVFPNRLGGSAHPPNAARFGKPPSRGNNSRTRAHTLFGVRVERSAVLCGRAAATSSRLPTGPAATASGVSIVRVTVLLIATALALPLSSTASANILIAIDKSAQHMSISVDGTPRSEWPASTGRAGYNTPKGALKVNRMDAEHFSQEWDNAPMPHAFFFDMKGSRPAGMLFDLVKAEGMGNATVVVSGRTPSKSEPGGRASEWVSIGPAAETHRPSQCNSYRNATSNWRRIAAGPLTARAVMGRIFMVCRFTNNSNTINHLSGSERAPHDGLQQFAGARVSLPVRERLLILSTFFQDQVIASLHCFVSCPQFARGRGIVSK
jgi:hypothetical protein